MSFSSTSQNIRLEGTVLKATCAAKLGFTGQESSLDLNKVLGNINGKLVWGTQDFGSTAENIHLDHTILHAELQKTDGGRSSVEFDLNKVISNHNGHLLAVNVPAAGAVPYKAAQHVINELEVTLGKNPQYKIYKASAGKETTLWYIDADREFKHNIFFKTFDNNTTLAITRIIESQDRPIEDVQADEIAAKNGANASYIEDGEMAFAPYAGVNAYLHLVVSGPPSSHGKHHTGKATAPEVKPGSIDTHVPGCGMTIGKRVNLSTYAGAVHIDCGVLFE